ncbi:DUF6452 family protein [Ascidiimonas sp. W6]|uniref:DUF6452 family protein n=1 Tax=Ascidiimonas meishanensis TaxID=3128903 RepID=UPI0030EE3BF1
MKNQILTGIVIITLIIFGVAGCQRDDLCAETDPTTPMLILKFQDSEEPEEDKSVTNLRVLAEGIETPLSGLSASTTDSISIPLRSFSSETTFILISDYEIDSEGIETGNMDTLRFDYTTKEVFISRACGFVANYETLTANLTNDSDNWIQTIIVNKDTITDETQTHVTILH